MNSKFSATVVAMGLLIVLLVLLMPIGIAPNTVGPNYRNVTVQTNVNITNSKPEIVNITIQDVTNFSLRNITLNAGGYKDIVCNVSVRDWNGFNDVAYVNATLWHLHTSYDSDIDNNNTHYTNTNCTSIGDGSGFYVTYFCNFSIVYYANNGTWICNASVMDYQSASNSRIGNTSFLPVYALNVTDGINYGNVAVEEFSSNTTANVSNMGNMRINVTVHGYGARYNDGLAMNCSLGGNITINHQLFSLEDIDWASKLPLSSSPQQIPGLTLSKQVDDNLVTNSTYWQLYVDSTNGPGGNCTGYVVFTAIAS
jgi:hypothetical protein